MPALAQLSLRLIVSLNTHRCLRDLSLPLCCVEKSHLHTLHSFSPLNTRIWPVPGTISNAFTIITLAACLCSASRQVSRQVNFTGDRTFLFSNKLLRLIYLSYSFLKFEYLSRLSSAYTRLSSYNLLCNFVGVYMCYLTREINSRFAFLSFWHILQFFVCILVNKRNLWQGNPRNGLHRFKLILLPDEKILQCYIDSTGKVNKVRMKN